MVTVVWEEVKQEGISWVAKRGLYRTKVPGGWLVRVQTSESDFIVFLPDPKGSPRGPRPPACFIGCKPVPLRIGGQCPPYIMAGLEARPIENK